MKSNDEAQSEAPSVDSILDSYANFKVWESKQDWEDGYDREGNIANSRNIAAAKINRLIVQGRLERGIYELERLEHDPQMFGDWEKVVEERIYLLETELSALSNNLSKGKV